MTDDELIELATNLFAAWSSGDADRPQPYLAEDAVLYDIVGGEHDGWPAIREFFATGIKTWPDLQLIPEQFWTNDQGVALNWVMSATVTEEAAARFGAGTAGKQWRSEGMSWLHVQDGRVVREVDYHDRGAIARSIGIA